MTRPDDIPEDVWVAAVLAVYDGRGTVSRKDAPTFERVARAILAERERAVAKIDEEIERARELGPHHVPVLSAVKRAIRGGAAHG